MSGNLYVSPPSSSPGSENVLPVNLKPTMNEKLMNTKSNRRRGFPNGIFSRRNNRNTMNSRQWGNTPFFTNAKPTSMLEKGWVRSRDKLKVGEKGLLTYNDGPQFDVEVVNKKLKIFKSVPWAIYSFKNNNDEVFELDDRDRFEEWDFYTATNPVAFVPKKGGKKTRRLRRKA